MFKQSFDQSLYTYPRHSESLSAAIIHIFGCLKSPDSTERCMKKALLEIATTQSS